MTTASPSTSPRSDLLEIHGEWNLEFSYAAGATASRFLIGLRDHEVLLASPCTSCERIYVPPRAFCEDCFVPTTDDWIGVGPEGSVEAYTITYFDLPGYPRPPYALAYVRPDGATTAMANFVTGIDVTDPRRAANHLAIGSRMVAEFGSERSGRITDFSWAPARLEGRR